MSASPKIYSKPLLTKECTAACLVSVSNNFDYFFAGLVGGTTTKDLCDKFMLIQRHPRLVVGLLRNMQDRLASEVRSHESMARSFLRNPPRKAFSVDTERGWLAIMPELIDRAESALALWIDWGGPAKLEQSKEKGKDKPATPPAPPVIEIHPTFNIEITQPQPENTGPAEVRVVSMPERHTTTTIEREGGEIVSTVQIQKDAQ